MLTVTNGYSLKINVIFYNQNIRFNEQSAFCKNGGTFVQQGASLCAWCFLCWNVNVVHLKRYTWWPQNNRTAYFR